MFLAIKLSFFGLSTIALFTCTEVCGGKEDQERQLPVHSIYLPIQYSSITVTEKDDTHHLDKK
jgi:hypothetical protein